MSTLTPISLHPQGCNINQLHTSNKHLPPFLPHFLKSKDTRKPVFSPTYFKLSQTSTTTDSVQEIVYFPLSHFQFYLSPCACRVPLSALSVLSVFFFSYCFANQISSPLPTLRLFKEIWYVSSLDLFNCHQCIFNLIYTFALRMNVACLFHDFQHSFGDVLK